jgi:hypothetical protein
MMLPARCIRIERKRTSQQEELKRMSLKRNIQVLAAVAAVFAFSAITASSALAVGDAPRWTVAPGGVEKTLGVGESRTFHGVSTGGAGGVGKLEVLGLFTLTNPGGSCTVTGNINGSAPNTPGTVSNVTLKCHEVHLENLPKCIVEDEIDTIPGTITTTPLHGVAEWLAANPSDTTGVTFTPPAGEPATRFLITDNPANPGCVFKNLTTKIEGSVIGEVETPGTDQLTQALDFPNAPIVHAWDNTTPTRVKTATTDGLVVGGKAAQFTNTFRITLTTNEPWGVETG